MADWYDSAKDAANAATGENHSSFARAFNAYWLKVKAAGGAVLLPTTAPAPLTDSTGGTVTTTLAAGITDAVAKNAIASLNGQLNALITALKTSGALK